MTTRDFPCLIAGNDFSLLMEVNHGSPRKKAKDEAIFGYGTRTLDFLFAPSHFFFSFFLTVLGR